MQQQEVPVQQDESLGSTTATSHTDPSPTYNRFGINTLSSLIRTKRLHFFLSSFIHAATVDRNT